VLAEFRIDEQHDAADDVLSADEEGILPGGTDEACRSAVRPLAPLEHDADRRTIGHE